MENNFKMKKLNNRVIKQKIDSSVGKRLDGRGAESQVHRVKLNYKESDKEVSGLVFKKYYFSRDVPTDQDFNIESVLSQWRIIKDKMKQRIKNGLPVFNLPPTIRVYEDEDSRGLIMTDLSKNGLVTTYDLKELIFNYTSINLSEWEQIKFQILRDVQIAEEENIKLGSGGSSKLDPWLIAMEEGGPKAYIVDIGEYTSINPHPEILRVVNKNIIKDIEDLDQEIKDLLKNTG